MTACDLSACTKPWEIQLEIVKVIYQEFYAEVSVVDSGMQCMCRQHPIPPLRLIQLQCKVKSGLCSMK